MQKLQSLTDYKVMSFNEATKALEWTVTEDEEYFEVKCNCENSKIRYSGFIGTEVIECEHCGKRMTDLFSPIATGNSTCTVLNPKNYEIEKDSNGNDRYWIAQDNKGGIKNI